MTSDSGRASLAGRWTVFLCAGVLIVSTPDTDAQVLQPKMGDPIAGLTAEQLDRFNIGQEKFNLTLSNANGLGPIFNKESCSNCHATGGIGGSGTQTVTRFGRTEGGVFDPLDELGGSLHQAGTINILCEEIIPFEANVQTQRITPSAFGAGLVESIPDAAILGVRDSQPIDVRGLAHLVQPFEDPMTDRVGRFGWKAQVATVLTFSADASLNELGLTNRFITEENAPNGDEMALAQCDNVPDPEDGPALGDGVDFIDRVTDFQRYLAPPPQTPRSGMAGEQIFNDIGCAVCHTPSFTTSGAAGLEEALRNQIVKPYSDFLLHDMGSLGDGIVQGAGTEQLMRTPSLWGIRVRGRLLHDGRALGDFPVRVAQAIAEHDGQGADARDAYQSLSAEDQALLIAFLDSLGKAEFDLDGDGTVDEGDVAAMADCFTGPGDFYTADDPCSVADVDQDGDVDLDDAEAFAVAYEGFAGTGDCDLNGIVDLIDIVTGETTDCDGNVNPDSCDIAMGEPDDNMNGILDACEGVFMRGDCNADGTQTLEDALYQLGILFLATGDPIPCGDACDVNDDGLYSIIDPIYNLNFQFLPGSPAPPAPHPMCGVDETPDGFECTDYSPCL